MSSFRFAFLGAVAALVATFGFAPASHGAQLGANVSTFTLDNGMEVVVIPDHRTPVATHMLWYRVGAADEEPGKSGLAHFVEHLMFKGTENHPEGEFSRVIAEIGGEENAFTASDYTGYFQRVAVEHLPRMMAFEADRMTNLTLTEAQVASELEVVIEERLSRVDNDPSSQLGEMMDAVTFHNHPYGRPIIGWEHEIRGLTREDALDFYARHYTPDNAILVVAGDVEAGEVRRLAEETYGDVGRRAEAPPRMRVREPRHNTARTVSLSSPRVDQESVRRAWLVPSYATAEAGDSEALDVLAEILGGGATGRLHRGLVAGDGIATSAGGWYQGSALDDTRFMLYGTPRAGVSLDELAAGFEEVIADLVDGGVAGRELERVKNSLIAQTVYAQDSQSSLARIFGVALTTGSSVEDVVGWLDRIDAVTAEDVVDVARRYLVPDRAVTGYLRSSPGAPAADAPRVAPPAATEHEEAPRE